MEAWKDDLEDEQDSGFDEDLFGGKNALLFLIDVSSPEMHEKAPDQSEGMDDTRLQLALKCVHATLRRKVRLSMLFSYRFTSKPQIVILFKDFRVPK